MEFIFDNSTFLIGIVAIVIAVIAGGKRNRKL